MVPQEQFNVSKLQLKKFDPPLWPIDHPQFDRKPTTPSEWFSKRFQKEAKIYGCPFIELNEQFSSGLHRITPLAPNLDFFAAILGGGEAMGHKVIYLEGEMQFYFYDPRDRIFKPTSDEKLQNLLRAYLIRCAEELPDTNHKLNLFLEFRSDKQTRAIVHRAKSILAADHTFFAADSKNVRQKGPETHERIAKVFVEQILERQAGEILTLTNAYLLFCEFLKRKSIAPPKRGLFKNLLCPMIREEFDLGLRNDLMDQNDKQQCGWKGIRALEMDEELSKTGNS